VTAASATEPEEQPMPATALPTPFDQLRPDDQETLRTHLEPLRFEAGTTIFTAGDDGDGTYLVDAGRVRLEMPRPELDTDGVLTHLEAGSVLGELALLDGLPRSTTAIADTDVELRRLPSAALDALAEDDPRLAALLLRALGQHAARKLRQSNEVLAEHVFADGRDPEVDDMVARAQAAQREIEVWSEERLDVLLLDIAQAIAGNAELLAKETVEETHIGNVVDKTTKNAFASMGIYQSLAGKRGFGVLGEASERGVTEVAAPVGVIFGIIPMTNPVATAIYKTLVALKSRNALILSFHRACLGVGGHTGELIHEALQRHGAPTDLVQWIRLRSDRKKTARFMSHEGVSLILATGGPGMVRAAYSSGTPAIGVGSGNAPTWITASADLTAAAEAVVLSKGFDNGLICGSEHNLVVDAEVRDPFLAALEDAGAAVLTPEEAEGFLAKAVAEDGRTFRVEVIGQSATLIAEVLGITRPHPIKLIVVPAEFDPGHPLSGEKMTPILSAYTVDGEQEGLALCKRILGRQGTGHTAIIHATDEAIIERFGLEMPASRILVNSPGSLGVCGVTTGLEPSFTLGCGTFGGNSTTDNVTYRNLHNVKRVARVTSAG
jgi:acyl-CoA reductase-like NAD-dependent aldehyde dehydrogenase